MSHGMTCWETPELTVKCCPAEVCTTPIVISCDREVTAVERFDHSVTYVWVFDLTDWLI